MKLKSLLCALRNHPNRYMIEHQGFWQDGFVISVNTFRCCTHTFTKRHKAKSAAMPTVTDGSQTKERIAQAEQRRRRTS